VSAAPRAIARASVGAASAPVAPAQPASAAASQPAAAEVLFARLAAARRSGDLSAARAAYGALAAGFPGSREERTARVVVAGLALAGQQPHGALALYESYLESEGAGALAEEARLGRALALDRLGRSAEEAQAWQELLARHPRSVHAARARARLAALGAVRR
jgi:TolA-binding protein